MTENTEIPSADESPAKKNERYGLAVTVVSLAVVLLFVILLSSSASAEPEEVVRMDSSQKMNLITPHTFGIAHAHGDASIIAIDDALIGNRSIIDSSDGGFIEWTGHRTNLYIVRKGDTISEIAESFGVSQNTVRWANNLNGKNLKIGQKLILLPISGVIHTVAKGDTVSKIAKKYDGDVDEILSYNNISAQELVVGKDITVPGGEIKASSRSIVTSSKTSGPVSVSGGSLKTVRSPSGLLEVTTGISYTWKNGVRTSQLRGTGGPSYSNFYIRPITGGSKSRGLHGFNSVDWAAPKGTPILASASGKVIVAKKSGWNGGYGRYVAIEHSNGSQTLYAHTSSIIVSQGQNVVQGQVIGYVGSTGNSSGNHLHFEVRGAKNPF